MLRIFVSSVAFLAITIVLLLHATHHGAHANSPTHCGFWTEIEAGLSLTSETLCGFHVHHCFGELLNGVNASVCDDCDNGKFSLHKFGRSLQRFLARCGYDLLNSIRLPRLSLHDEHYLAVLR